MADGKEKTFGAVEETEAEDACETIALCLKLSCGKQNKKIREEN